MTALKNLPYQLPLHSCHIFNLHIHTLLSAHTHAFVLHFCRYSVPLCLLSVHTGPPPIRRPKLLLFESWRGKKKLPSVLNATGCRISFRTSPRQSNKVRKLATLYLQCKTWESVFASREVCSYCKK